tara:strand:+ start:889 stop:1182 length:294 start_codon:yes stop_codon:yes gene_type:complete
MSTTGPLNYMSSIIGVRKKEIVVFVVMSRVFLIAAATAFPNLRITITHDSQFDKSSFNFDKSRFNSVLKVPKPKITSKLVLGTALVSANLVARRKWR